MKIGDLIRHRTFGCLGIVTDTELEVDRRFRYIEVHWITGDLSPIWFLDHELLEIVG